MPGSPATRRHDLDLLRVLACYLLLLFHVGMVFNPAPFYHVRNHEVGIFFLVLCGFIGLWHMPLFFLLAGWSAAASLSRRGVAAFLRERGSKLALPLVAGCVLLAPGIKYLELRSGLDLNHRGLFVSEEMQQRFREDIGAELPLAAPFDQGFLEFLPGFFGDLDRFSWSHLWFLAYLLCLTLLLLPLFARLLARAVGPVPAAGGWLHAPLLPLVAIQLWLRPHFPGPYNLYHDWANLSFFATFLVSGFLLALAPGLEERIRVVRWRSLGCALAAALLLLGFVIGWIESPAVVGVGAAIAGWYFVLALLGFAREHVKQGDELLDYLVESAFPVYLLHQSVVVGLGFVIVQWSLPIAPKFALLLLASTVVTLALHHFVVRRFALARLLAGLKPRVGQRPAAGRPIAPTRSALGRS